MALQAPPSVLFSYLQGTVVFVFFGCGGQLPPPGGPPDTTPPEIVRTFPPNNATNIATKYLELEFSELVDRRSVQESIFISPPIGTLEFDWSGRRVKVGFDEDLKNHTTYVVNIGTDVVDTRARIRMAAAHTLAFSTGDVIDPGVIEGRVYDDEPEGLMIFGYRLDPIQPDTLNPSVTKPDYVTQTGKGGLFALNFIALGSYRLYAARDEHRNLLYDPEVDAYGVLQSDVTLTSDQPTAEGVHFRLAKEDTSGPILVSARPPDRNHLEIRFNEPVQFSFPWHQAISILDTLTGTPLEILSVFSHVQNPEVFTVVTSKQDSSAMYRVAVSGAFDHQRNPIQLEARTSLFQASDTRDSLASNILYTSIEDSTRNVPFSSVV
ncbi:MAG: Ig-like domain-containing protein, partial [Bacteroidota bacterium]